MKITNIANDSDRQIVELPAGAEFPPQVSTLIVSVVGVDRVLRPAPQNWDSFFSTVSTVSTVSTEDFMSVRASQQQDERETF